MGSGSFDGADGDAGAGCDSGGDGDRNAGHPDGYDGRPDMGGAIMIMNGASPTIKNCIIRDNLAHGGDGGNGVSDQTANSGRGGWAGWARGGGVWCGPNSSPTFINCLIEK